VVIPVYVTALFVSVNSAFAGTLVAIVKPLHLTFPLSPSATIICSSINVLVLLNTAPSTLF